MASFASQLMALVAPLFTLVVIDKANPALQQDRPPPTPA